MDFEQQEGLKAPKYLPQIIIGLILAISIGFNINIALKGWKDKIYQEGVAKGQDTLVQQIRSGALVNFEDGTIGFIKKQ